MDAGPILQSNASKTFIALVHQLELSQVDELAGVEDDLQVGIANKYSGRSRFNQVSSSIAVHR